MDSLVNVNVELSPSEKLMEVISSALGAWIAPWSMKRMAKAEAEAERIKAIEGAKTEALLVNNEAKYIELSTIEKRLVAKEEKRHKNIEKVVAVAAHTIKDESNLSSEPVNPDWATRFFDIAQDISDEAMQDLWGRILAGEVERPNSYSLRTLDILKNITSKEANMFEEIANYVISYGTVFIFNGSKKEIEKYGIQYYKIAQLVEAGLIQSGSSVVQHFYLEDGKQTTHYLIYGDYLILLEQPANLVDLTIPIYVISSAGQEILKLLKPVPNFDYIAEVAKYIKKKYSDVKICYTKIISTRPNGEIEYDNSSYVSL